MSVLTVARRFRGPTESANGGYICGLIASSAPGPVTVRLLRPPPLETPLAVIERHGLLDVLHGEEPVAQARPGNVGNLVPPRPPTPREAVEASARYAGFSRHPAPECFVCGPERAHGDGLCIFAGTVAAGAAVAAPWVPDPSLDRGDGRIGIEFAWAALDCPGYAAVAPDMRQMLLGELTARVDRCVQIGEPCTVVGWQIGASGRKHEAGTALYGADGVLCAHARALWIEPRAAAAG